MEIIMIHNHETWTSTCECEFMASGPVTRMSNHCIRYGWLFFSSTASLLQDDWHWKYPLQRRTTKVLIASSMLTTCLNPTACSTSTTAVVQSHLINHCLFAFCTVAQHSDSLHILVVRYMMMMMISLHHSSNLDFPLGLSTVMSIRLRRFIFCSLPSVPTRKLWPNHNGVSAPFGLYGHWRSFTRVLHVLFTVVLSFQALTSGNHSFSVVKMACTA